MLIDFPFDKIKGKVVGVQLPDGLKPYAEEIVEILERRGFEVILSGKPSYGACDIDLEILKHVDVLLHVGHTKLLNHDRVIYVPYRVEYDVDLDLLKSEIREKRITIIGTASYAWKFGEVRKILEKGFEVVVGRGKRMEYEGQVLGCDYSSLNGLKYDAILFIGDGRFHAIGASMYTGKKVYAYNPITGEVEPIDSQELLRKRYFTVSKAKLCESFGILVSTKPGQRRFKLALKLREIAKKIGKRAGIILADEITPQLTENFRFDCYVNTACPRIVYDDQERFKKPILTPPEFEVVLGLRSEILMDSRDYDVNDFELFNIHETEISQL